MSSKKNSLSKKGPDKSPIYVPNEKLGITDWIPSVKKETSSIRTNSWFDIEYYDNPNPINTIEYNKDVPIISPELIKQNKKKKFNPKPPEFLYCEKIRIYPTEDQIEILHRWFDQFAKMFNVTVNYIRGKIYPGGKLNIKLVKKNCGFRKLRDSLSEKKKEIQNLTDINKIPVHVLDEAIRQAASNHVACATNYQQGNIKKFRVREWDIHKRRKILKIEEALFSNGAFCTSTFPEMESSGDLNTVNRTSTLQYDRDTGKYILFVPRLLKKHTVINKQLSCGIDPGVRTFATVYSQNGVQNICNSKTYQKNIRKYQKKIDKINHILNTKNDIHKHNFVTTKTMIDDELVSNIKLKKINKKKLLKGLRKYHKKISDKIKDMHFKAAHELVHTYDNIYIGKFNTKSILSKNNITISSATKRIISTTSPYLFRMRLTYMGYKYGSKVIPVNEYLTTKTCSNCGIKNELGAKKVHKCKCGMTADRDENAAKNILKVGLELENE